MSYPNGCSPDDPHLVGGEDACDCGECAECRKRDEVEEPAIPQEIAA